MHSRLKYNRVCRVFANVPNALGRFFGVYLCGDECFVPVILEIRSMEDRWNCLFVHKERA